MEGGGQVECTSVLVDGQKRRLRKGSPPSLKQFDDTKWREQ